MGADLSAWIGRRETLTDVAARDRAEGLLALLDGPGEAGRNLPPLGHWLLCRPNVRQSEIDADGHPKRDDASLLPPVALPRRMWAGSEVEFLRPIPIGAEIARHSTVTAIEKKHGRSGTMVFVTVAHEIHLRDAVAIRERQDIVYRDRPAAGTATPAPTPAPVTDMPAPENSRAISPDPVQLFRYSALTFNAHRIHYDRDYARDVEGYPGLVVQGPYAATLLLDHVVRHHPGAKIARFAFRATAPLFDTAPFTLCQAGEKLWIRKSDGAVAMTADLALA